MNDAFAKKIEVARQFEKALAAWFQTRFGAYILPTYDYSGLQEDKPPKLLAESESLVIPDLLICRRGKTTWVECKWKSSTALHRNTNTPTTGINLRHWEHYLRVRRVSGCDVVVMFIHIAEQEMRGDTIETLRANEHHRYDGGKMGRDGMIFWDWGKLRRWCTLAEVCPHIGTADTHSAHRREIDG